MRSLAITHLLAVSCQLWYNSSRYNFIVRKYAEGVGTSMNFAEIREELTQMQERVAEIEVRL